jgi:hypothetical protein
MSKYGHRSINWFEAIVNKLGGENAAERFLRGELAVSEPVCSWREKDGVIYFTVISDGTTGPAWIERLEAKGFRLSKWAKDVLNSKDFKPTNGVVTEIAVLKGMLWNDSDRITKRIRKDAYEGTFTGGNKLFDPNPEAACLIREMFSDEELEAMGLWWIVAMHEPIKDSDGDPRLLSADRDDDGRWLSAYYDGLVGKWGRGSGFAFALSQVSPQDSESQA